MFKALDGKTPAQIDALRREYHAHYKRDLDADIRSELSGNELSRAESLLKGNQAAADADRLNVAIAGAGTDEAAIVRTLEGKSASQIDAIKGEYSSRHGQSLEDAVRGDLSGPSLQRVEALLRGDSASAEAAALNEAMKGGLTGAGTDEGSVYKALEKKSPAEREAIVRAYGRMYGSGENDRILERHIREEFSSAELDRATSLLAGDQIGADAARVRHAMKGGVLGLGTDTQDIQDTFEGRSESDRRAIVAAYGGKYGDLDSDLKSEMGEYELGKTRALIDRGRLSDTESLYYAVMGGGTDEAAIRATLRGKSSEQIDQVRADYRRDFGRDLDADLRGDLSGRDAFDVGQLLKGKPKTLEEALERANENWAYERGGAANFLSRSIMDDISPDKGQLLDGNMQRANQIYQRAKSENRPLSASERAELGRQRRYSEAELRKSGHHDPASPNFRGGGDMTTHLPPDAEAVYARALPEPGQKGNIWWGRSDNGDWYRFAGGERGVHWNGATGATGGGRVIRDHEVPGAVRRQFQLEEDVARGRVKLDDMRARSEELGFYRDYFRMEADELRARGEP